MTLKKKVADVIIRKVIRTAIGLHNLHRVIISGSTWFELGLTASGIGLGIKLMDGHHD